MSNQILVPSLGESVTEATVSKWLKQVGEHVNADEPLVELETDKVNVEVPSPLNGTLSSISVKEGDSVEVGALLGIVADGKSKTKETKKTVVEEKSNTIQKQIKTKKISKNKTSKEQKTLKLTNEEEDTNSNGALVLETLAEDNSVEVENKKEYIPPKSRKNLHPSVRKIV